MKEFRQFVNKLSKDWTLFLDRDGVINKRLPDEYVKTPEEFEFIAGTKESMQLLSGFFGRIIVVTNQQGIGKALMTTQMLERIHDRMLTEISLAGGKIDRVYYCPDMATDPANCRKPGGFMAYQAKMDFPEIDFQKSVMVGDSASDIAFGSQLKMTTVYVGDGTIRIGSDFVFASLSEFTQHLVHMPGGEEDYGK